MYREEKAMTCFLFYSKDMPEELKEYIQKDRFDGKIDEVFCGSSIDEINTLLDKYKSSYKYEHGYHWAVVGGNDNEISRRWEGHYFPIKEWSIQGFKDVSRRIDKLAESGCWWDKAYIEPEWKELYDEFEKVIFLDIDGVLNHIKGKNYIEEDLLENLAMIVQKTEAKIILTSSWRRYYLSWAQRAFPEERDDFGWFLDDKLWSVGLHLSGVTPIIFDGPEGRPFEIRRWLSRQGKLKSFVILDDEPFWKWNWLSPYVVETYDDNDSDWQHVSGLTKAKAEMAVRILNELRI